jgi:hypothetical protein
MSSTKWLRLIPDTKRCCARNGVAQSDDFRSAPRLALLSGALEGWARGENNIPVNAGTTNINANFVSPNAPFPSLGLRNALLRFSLRRLGLWQ